MFPFARTPPVEIVAPLVVMVTLEPNTFTISLNVDVTDEAPTIEICSD